MSILIKGMEMPESCNKCPLSVNGYCRIIGYPNGDAISKRYKPLWCPLAEVPMHGRLIDADALMEHIGRERLDSRERIAQMVNTAPTIIEAEE